MNMTDEEIKKLYARYESRLGATMTKTIGLAMLELYTVVASTFLPIPAGHRTYLCESLEKDPFIQHAISAVSCEFYHRYGMFLTPVTTTSITARYCQIKHKCPLTNNGDGNTNPDCGNEETQAFAQPQQAIASQAIVTKNPRQVAAGRKGALARKAKLIHNSNIEHSPIKIGAPCTLGVVAITVVWLFYKTGEEKTSQAIAQSQQAIASQVQLELSPHVML